MDGTFGTQLLAAETADTFIMIDGYNGFVFRKAYALGRTGFHTDTASFAKTFINKGLYSTKGS